METKQRKGWDGWAMIARVYALYVVCYGAGYFIGNDAGAYVGAAIMLWTLFFTGGLEWEEGPVVPLALFLFVWPLIGIVVGGSEFYFVSWFKQAYLLLLFLGIRGLGLSPLPTTRFRSWFLVSLVAILFVSFFFGFNGPAGRHAGLFVNSNNYALVAFGLLLLLDEERDSPKLRYSLHAFLIVVLMVASTVGAFLGYSAAWGYRFREKLSHPKTLFSGLALLVLAVSLYTLTGLGNWLGHTHLAERLSGQWTALSSNSSEAFSGSLNYGTLVEENGEGSTSGLWRISHWSNALRVFSSSGWQVIFFGMGIGAFIEHFGNMAHNDFLRILVEQGVVGFLAMGWLLWSLVKAVPWQRQFGVVAFLGYCFSENNIDNILYMSLWVMFLATADNSEPEEEGNLDPGSEDPETAS